MDLSRGMRCWDRWQVREGRDSQASSAQNPVTPPAYPVPGGWGQVCVELA